MCSSSFAVLGVISLVENIPFVIYNIHRKEYFFVVDDKAVLTHGFIKRPRRHQGKRFKRLRIFGKSI